MSAWAEVRQLQEELYNVQLQTAKNKLSERNCVAVIQRLVSLGWLDVLYSCDGKEYITPKQLEKDIIDELYVSGGRAAMTDLAQTLNVDYSHIERKVTELLSRDSNLAIHYGELISKQFFDNLALEINETLQETGLLPLNQLSREVSLPVTVLAKELTPRIGDIIEGTYDKKTDTLFTKAYVERQTAKLRGACSAATRPIQLGKIMESHSVTTSLGHNCVKEMILSGRLHGQLQGQSNNPVFIPELYLSAQNQWADSFYEQNGYITFDMMNKKGIDNPHSLISRYEDAIQVPSGCISTRLLASTQSIVEECIISNSYIEAIDWVFDWCRDGDEKKLMELVLKNVKPEDYRILPSNTIISVSLLNQLLNEFDSKIADQVKTDAGDPKVVTSLKKFDAAASLVSDAKTKKGKGGRKGKKGKVRDDDDEEYKPSKPSIGPTFLTIQQIELELKGVAFMVDNEPKEESTFGEIGEMLKKQLDERYCKELDDEVRRRTCKSSKSQQKADEETINHLYNTVILCEKGLKVFEENVKVQIEKHVLKTLCTDLAKSTFSILSEEYECPFKGNDMKMDKVVPYLPKNAKDHATAVIASVTSGSTVEQFLEHYTNLTDPEFTQLLVKKLDKKKERNMIFSQKQSLLEQLKTEVKSPELLNIACNLMFIKQHSTLLHVPGRCISAVIKVLSAEASPAHREVLDTSLAAVVTELKGDGQMEEGTKEALRSLVTEVLFGKQDEME